MECSRLIKAPFDEDAAAVVGVDIHGGHMATANLAGDVTLWSGTDGRSKLLKGHDKRVLSMAFSPIGDTLCSGSADGSINVWSTISGECMQVAATSLPHS